MKYYEFSTKNGNDYMALISAESKEEAIKIYKRDVVGDEIDYAPVPTSISYFEAAVRYVKSTIASYNDKDYESLYNELTDPKFFDTLGHVGLMAIDSDLL